MSVPAIHPSLAGRALAGGPLAGRSLPDGPARFAAAGATFRQELSVAAPDDRAATARTTAEQLVSEVFVEPLLASLREHSLAAGPFSAGAAERRFGPMLDEQIAERVTRGANLPLVQEIARRLTERSLREASVPAIQESNLAIEA